MNTSEAVKELRQYGLTVDSDGAGIRGATSKDGPFYQGPFFAIEHCDGWCVRLTGHLKKWSRLNTFSELEGAVAFIKEVYGQLMDFQTDGWKPAV